MQTEAERLKRNEQRTVSLTALSSKSENEGDLVAEDPEGGAWVTWQPDRRGQGPDQSGMADQAA